MTLTSAACPLTDVIEDQTQTALEGLVDRWVINWVWMPPWGMEMITEDGRDQLRALGLQRRALSEVRFGEAYRRASKTWRSGLQVDMSSCLAGFQAS